MYQLRQFFCTSITALAEAKQRFYPSSALVLWTVLLTPAKAAQHPVKLICSKVGRVIMEQSSTLITKTLKCLCMLYNLKTPGQHRILRHFSGSMQLFRHKESEHHKTTHAQNILHYVLVPSMAAASYLWRGLALKCINTGQSQPIHQ